MLTLDIFKTVVEATPLIFIDFLIRNSDGYILSGKRVNKPAQGFWFVPGGRILKGEAIEQAYNRLLKAELGINHIKATFKCIYQHFYKDNFLNNDFSTHYVVLAYTVQYDCNVGLLPLDQHHEYLWLSQTQLLANDDVHEHTKWYFQDNKKSDNSIIEPPPRN
jgi:colanic acid biosynthesis protein WcaH